MSKFTYAMTKTACLYCHQNGSRTQLCECDFLLWNWSAFESTAIKHGAWCMVYGMWYMVCGMVVYGAMCMVYGVWCILILLRVAVKGTVRLKPGA